MHCKITKAISKDRKLSKDLNVISQTESRRFARRLYDTLMLLFHRYERADRDFGEEFASGFGGQPDATV